MENIKLKVCKTCGQEKPITEYSKHKNTRDLLNPVCKSCVSEYNKKY